MKKGIKLNLVITLIVIAVTVIVTSINFYSSAKALKKSLTQNYLVSNHHYTKKLAESVEYITTDLQKNITAMAKLHGVKDISQKDLDALFEAEKGNFHSIFITDTKGEIQLISPYEIISPHGGIMKAGTIVDSAIVNKSITEKQPFISEPYITKAGTVFIFVTAPIFKGKTPAGVMAGTVYLHEENAINYLIKTHDYSDGSFVYVVDHQGRIVFHPDSGKLFTDVKDDPIVKSVLGNEKGGYREFTDSNYNKYFAGYSYIKSLGWGIISVTPASTLNEPIKDLFIDLLSRSFVIAFIIIMIVTVLVSTLTKPITQLAEYSEKSILSNKINNPKELLNINSHIYEVKQLYLQVQSHIEMLNKAIQLDGLTELANRRTFDEAIKEWVEIKQPFALLLLDIDNFKQINDTYGHLMGDDVIQYLAGVMKSFAGVEDLCFRYGGEEFGILLKNYNEKKAYVFAEKLRRKVAESISPTGSPITVSIGITVFTEKDVHPNNIINRADQALYRSKRTGKNKTTAFSECEVNC